MYEFILEKSGEKYKKSKINWHRHRKIKKKIRDKQRYTHLRKRPCNTPPANIGDDHRCVGMVSESFSTCGTRRVAWLYSICTLRKSVANVCTFMDKSNSGGHIREQGGRNCCSMIWTYTSTIAKQISHYSQPCRDEVRKIFEGLNSILPLI